MWKDESTVKGCSLEGFCHAGYWECFSGNEMFNCMHSGQMLDPLDFY